MVLLLKELLVEDMGNRRSTSFYLLLDFHAKVKRILVKHSARGDKYMLFKINRNRLLQFPLAMQNRYQVALDKTESSHLSVQSRDLI